MRMLSGRMGSPKASAYLASPAVVAASAIKGYICTPAHLSTSAANVTAASKPVGQNLSVAAAASTAARTPPATSLAEGFPSLLKGVALFLPANNLNTDGIYPGKYTYNESMT